MSLEDIVRLNLQYEEDLLEQVDRIRVTAPEGRLTVRMNGGYKAYYLWKDGQAGPKYVTKKKRKQVEKIRLERFLKESRETLERNIRLQREFLDKYVPADFETINAKLPKAYRYDFDDPMPFQTGAAFRESENPYRREELIHKTSFGLAVRSKGEVMIGEILFAAGLDFYYEKALRLIDENGNIRVVYPDFWILLSKELVFYWEHKGLFADAEYFERDQRKMQLYHRNGIYEPKNLIVTKDGPDGSFDVEAVKRLVYGVLLPLRRSKTRS